MRGWADAALRVGCGLAAGREELGGRVIEFRVLGALEVHDGTAPVPVPGAKERALLADLLVNAGRVVPADRLIEDLWGERAPGNPANTLQGRVSALRRALGPAAPLLVTRPPGYALQADPEQLDAARFERLVAEAAPADGPAAVRLLEQALGLWRGPALAEFADQPWAQAEAARLEELRLNAVESRAELLLAGGGHDGLVGELEALVAAEPLRERLRGLLMVALYRSGRQADALAVYQETRALLAEELGIDPSPQLQRLHQAILVQDPSLDAAGPAPAAPAHNLPVRLTSFVGREQSLGDVAKLVGQQRLVTLLGPGGVGKTSLAVELARRLAGGYPDGVWLVELAGLRDPRLLAEVVAAALGLSAEPGPAEGPPPAPAERLLQFAADKQLLVVLDNCEHLAAACAELVERLLRAGPAVKVLATSREVLGVPGEVVWPVPPLAVPDPSGEPGADAGPAPGAPSPGIDGAATPEALQGVDAVRLFLDRALAADPGFTLDAGNAGAVAEICRRLDGLPLAIELAAARVRALPATELAARLDDRFRLLAGAGRTLDPRQQTLRAAIDWSYQLLDEPDRRLLARLSVFAGGWTIAAAEAVCGGDGINPGDVLDGLVRLVDRSLVVAAGGDPVRYQLLETLRAYGAERLDEAGETEAVGRRHTRFYLELAEEAAPHRSARRWVLLLDADYANLRAALDRAVAGGELETALGLAGALGWYWWTFHHEEGREHLARVLALADGSPPTPQLARALLAAAGVEITLTPTAAAMDKARNSLELFERFGDRQAAATARLLLGMGEWQLRGPSDLALELVEQAGAAFRELGDPWGEAYAGHARLLISSYLRGPPDDAEEIARRNLERFRALDDPLGIGSTLFGLGGASSARGDVAGAVRWYSEGLAVARREGPLWVVCATLVELGSLAAIQGDHAQADALHAEGAVLARRTGQRRGIAFTYNAMGGVARARGQLERARQLHREALVIVREVLGWSVPHTLGSLACAEARLGDLDDAEAHLREAATLLLVRPQPATAAMVLVGAALVAAGRGRPELGARLLGAAEATRERAGVLPVGAERVEAELARQALAARLEEPALAAALAAGRELTHEQVLRAVLD